MVGYLLILLLHAIAVFLVLAVIPSAMQESDGGIWWLIRGLGTGLAFGSVSLFAATTMALLYLDLRPVATLKT